MIKLINLTKKFDTRTVLNNISYEFPSRGISVIYGPSGSGKTTLLNCIAGLINYSVLFKSITTILKTLMIMTLAN